jgi:hypothetical protein
MRGLSYITTYNSFVYKTVLVVFLLTSCNYNNLKTEPNSNGDDVGNLSGDALISDELVMSYSLRTCQKCHAGAKQPTLDTASAVRANITKVLSSITGGTMPPPQEPTRLSACQIAIVQSWADGTAARISEIAECKSEAPPEVLPTVPVIPIELMPLNFETLKTRILDTKCLYCHNPKGDDWEAAEVSFETYADIASGDYSKYWKSPAATSKVYKEITYNNETSDNGMPPNDSNTARVTKEEIDYIVRWIDAGKPEF